LLDDIGHFAFTEAAQDVVPGDGEAAGRPVSCRLIERGQRHVVYRPLGLIAALNLGRMLILLKPHEQRHARLIKARVTLFSDWA
jgi:hypothetical protein